MAAKKKKKKNGVTKIKLSVMQQELLQDAGQQAAMAVQLLPVPRAVGHHDRQRPCSDASREWAEMDRPEGVFVDTGVALVDLPRIAPVVPEVDPSGALDRFPRRSSVADKMFDARQDRPGIVGLRSDDSAHGSCTDFGHELRVVAE